jgi:hypothetical protein
MTETSRDLECFIRWSTSPTAPRVLTAWLGIGAEGIAALKDEGVMTGESHGRSD